MLQWDVIFGSGRLGTISRVIARGKRLALLFTVTLSFWNSVTQRQEVSGDPEDTPWRDYLVRLAVGFS